MLNDRRKFIRFDVSLDIAFKTSGESDVYFTGVTKNFSRTGLCFVSQASGLALKESMKLIVKLPDNNTFVSVSGNVTWMEQFKDRCWVGITLEEMEKEAKSQILDYAYDLWVEENKNRNTAVSG
jgi:c-di-GMP-binding flagellar brake protein YcgR